MKKQLSLILVVLAFFFTVRGIVEAIEVRKYFFAAVPQTCDIGTENEGPCHIIGGRDFRGLYIFGTHNGRDIVLIPIQKPAQFAIAEADSQYICHGYSKWLMPFVTVLGPTLTGQPWDYMRGAVRYLFDVKYEDEGEWFWVRLDVWLTMDPRPQVIKFHPHRVYSGIPTDGLDVVED